MINRVLAVAVIIILLLLFIHPIDVDGDFFQHVNIGRYVITHHALPHHDDLTFTAAGHEYIGYAWLAGLVFYGIYSTAGAIGINVLVLSIALLTFFLLYRYLRLIHVSARVSILTILFVAPVVATRWPSRPEIFLYPILLGFLLIDELKIKHPRILILNPILMLLIVNLYGSSFPMAAGILMLLTLKNLVKREQAKEYCASVVASVLLAWFNGYGLKSLFFIFLIPKMTMLWGDWIGLWEIIRRPELNFAREISIIYCLFTGYVLILALWNVRKLKKYPVFAVIACTVLLPFTAIRMRSLAAILSAPLIALLLTNVRARWIVYFTGFVALGMTVLFVVTNPPALGENADVFPPALIQFIKTNNITGNVFNTPRIGSFLSYYLAPPVRVFSDTRDDLFIGTGVLEATQAFLSTNAGPQYLIRKYHADFAIVSLGDGNSFRDLIYDDQWALVYFKNGYLIFVPRSVVTAKNLPVLDGIDPYSPTGVKTAAL